MKKTEVIWTKGRGIIDSDGHGLTWWKAKIKKMRPSHYNPVVMIEVDSYAPSGARRKGAQFLADELKEAKSFAKDTVTELGGSATLEARVRIPSENREYRVEEIGEYSGKRSDGFYIWMVDRETMMPVSRTGRYEDRDEAVRDARAKASSGQLYDAVVSFGDDPEAEDFEIYRGFKAWAGETHYQSEYGRLRSRLREHR